MLPVKTPLMKYVQKERGVAENEETVKRSEEGRKCACVCVSVCMFVCVGIGGRLIYNDGLKKIKRI